VLSTQGRDARGSREQAGMPRFELFHGRKAFW